MTDHNDTGRVKFLIIRFSSIGDMVLTSPVVRCLKQQVEGSEIHYVTKSKYLSVISENPYIDKIHVLDKNMGWLINQLKKENFDYVIDLHNNIRSLRIKSAMRRMSFSFNKLNIRKWLLVQFKWNKLPDIHIVDRYLATLGAFSVENDMKGLDYFIAPSDETEIKSLIGKVPDKPIALLIGGGHYTKQIPVGKINELISMIDNDIVLLGGKEDVLKAGKITGKENVFNCVGKLNLGQTASVIKQSFAVITSDTGAMHIASAFKKNVLSVWGNTIPGFGMYPYLPGPDSKIFEIKGLYCRPCSKIGYDKCPQKHFRCMMDQNIQDLTNFLKSIQEKEHR